MFRLPMLAACSGAGVVVRDVRGHRAAYQYAKPVRLWLYGVADLSLAGEDSTATGGRLMQVVVDSREQCPFSFTGPRYADVEVVADSLGVGDYSLAGLVDRVAVERKELADLVQCLGRERERFERELQRGMALDAFSVVVEASWADLAAGRYRSRLNPHAACQSVAAFMARYRTCFFFAGSRAAAEYVTWSFLRQYLEGARRRWKAIATAHGEGGAAA